MYHDSESNGHILITNQCKQFILFDKLTVLQKGKTNAMVANRMTDGEQSILYGKRGPRRRHPQIKKFQSSLFFF